MRQIIRDLRLALRTLKRSAIYSISVAATLTLTIAANVVMLALVDTVLVRDLPFERPNDLYWVLERRDDGAQRLPSYPTVDDWRRAVRDVRGVGFVRGTTARVTGSEGVERIIAAAVSPGYFTIVGARVSLGRIFAPEEETRSGAPVVLLSEHLWRRQFAADPAIVGRSMRLDDEVVTIVGVVRAASRYPEWADLWRPIEPLVPHDLGLANRDVHSDSRTIVRLVPGSSPARAAAAIRTAQRGLVESFPASYDRWNDVELTPLRDAIVGDSAGRVLLLGGAVLLLLLIACANIGGLAVVRTLARARELAVRAALGASRRQLARLIVAESAVLTTGAGVVGTIGAAWLLRGIRALAPTGVPRVAELTMDARAIGIAVAITAIAAVLIGVLPALRPTVAPFDALRSGRVGSSGVRRARLRAGLTIVQIALAFALSIGAGLLVQSFRRVQQVDLGYEPERAMTLGVFPPSPAYASAARAADLYRRLAEAVRAASGVEEAAITNHVPGGGGIETRLEVAGRSFAPDEDDRAIYKTVSETYLQVMGIPLRRGRWFSSADVAGASNGVVVSETLARRLWPNEDPLGKAITVFRSAQGRPDYGRPLPSVVIGVVGSVRQFGPERPFEEEVFVPYTRETWHWTNLVVRTRGEPRAIKAALERAVRAVEPALPIAGPSDFSGFVPLTTSLSEYLEPRRLATWLISIFSVAALLLAALGLYAVSAYGVSQRTQEIGVRMALGATSRRVLGKLLREAGSILGIGLLLGGGAAFALVQSIRALLFETRVFEARPVLIVAVVLALTVMAAALIPAWRASRVDPTEALRSD
jgi:putative ABC transport system permease protein